MIKLEITQEHAGMRLSACVAENLPELASFNLKKMIKAGDIKLNGCLVKKDFEVEPGDIVEVYVPVEYERFPLLDIVYEDKNIIVLNKQPGTVVAGRVDAKTPELMSMVINYMRDAGEYSEEAGYIPFMCYKLDLYTGGLVMFAKNAEYFEAIREAVRQRRLRRIFRAIVKGQPEYARGDLRHFYVKDNKDQYRVSTRKMGGSVPIYTRYEVVESNGIFSIVDIEPVTQYLNQERAHMEAAGYPILGDQVYGDGKINKKLGIQYQALWATKICFDTGVNNMLEYLNGSVIETDDTNFPLVNFD